MPSVKNVLIYSIEFPPGPGGIGNHAWNLGRYLAVNGIKTTVFCHSRSEYYRGNEQFDKEQPFNIIRVEKKSNRLLTVLNRTRLLTRSLRKNKFSHIFLSGRFALFLLPLIKLLSKNSAVIYVAHAGDVITTNNSLKKIIRTLLLKVNHIIAVSNFTANKLPDILKPKIQVIFNGFHAPSFELQNKPYPINGSLNLVTVGSVHQRKGQHNVVRALSKIIEKYPQCQYHIIGEIQDSSFVNAELDKNQELKNHLTFYGAVSNEEKYNALQNADIFLMLSEEVEDGDYEGFGIALIEANYMKLPTIGSKGCGIEDAISDRYNGILVNAHDPKDVLNAIDMIKNNYRQYSENAKRFSNDFSWDKIIHQYIQFLSLQKN